VSRKKENIVRYSEAELRAMHARGETRSDWEAAARKPLPDGADPDDAMEEAGWATTELPMPKRKVHTNLRIDADVLAYFREQGKGYQTKINAVLRSYVEQVTRRGTDKALPKKISSREKNEAKIRRQ
jgi:uncharacterized protein (DUF4415 family)